MLLDKMIYIGLIVIIPMALFCVFLLILYFLIGAYYEFKEFIVERKRRIGAIKSNKKDY